MRFATSFCNGTLYRKTMARFWPMWTLWGVFWLFVLPLNLLNSYFNGSRWSDYSLERVSYLLDVFQDIPYTLEAGVGLACCGGALCAMAVFGYLYNNRSAGMMHGLPLTRDSLFITQYLAGLSFLLLPLLAVFVVTLPITLLLPGDYVGYAITALVSWLGAMMAACLFFFSFAAFCAMFTGHILALPAFYGILNMLAYVISTLIANLLNEAIFGYNSYYIDELQVVEWLTPVWALYEAADWNRVSSIATANDKVYAPVSYALESPATLAVYALVGVVLAAAALLVYRRRHVETAGDVVSVPLVRPVFRCGVAFCVGLCCGTVTASFFGWNDPLALCGWAVAWSVVGWFAAEMLLKKSFRVWKCWKGGLVMAAVLGLLCVGLCFDWLGLETKVPDPENVASLRVSGNLSYPYDSGDLDVDSLTDPRMIALFTDLHQAIVDDRDRSDRDSASFVSGDDHISINLVYTLKNGTTLRRTYSPIPVRKDEVNIPGTVTNRVMALITDGELKELAYRLDFYRDLRLVDANLYPVWLGDDQQIYRDSIFLGSDLPGLWQAVQADFAEGNLGVRYLFEDEARFTNTYRTDLRLSFDYTEALKKEGVSYATDFIVTLTPQARHTLAWLRDMAGLDSEFFLVTHNDTDPELAAKYPELAEKYGEVPYEYIMN